MILSLILGLSVLCANSAFASVYLTTVPFKADCTDIWYANAARFFDLSTLHSHVTNAHLISLWYNWWMKDRCDSLRHDYIYLVDERAGYKWILGCRSLGQRLRTAYVTHKYIWLPAEYRTRTFWMTDGELRYKTGIYNLPPSYSQHFSWAALFPTKKLCVKFQ